VSEELHDAESGEDEPSGGAPAWMVTFGDMMSLLLTFFVLLLSYSTMDITKFQMMLQSIKVGFGAMSATAIVQPNVPQFGDDQKERSQTDEESIYLAMRVEELIDDADISSAIELHREEAGILLRVRGGVMFEPGSAKIKMESFAFLEKLAELLSEFPHNVLVSGHTDGSSVPPTSPFPSNWELSGSRAAAVVRHLTAMGLPERRFAAIGYADTRPIATNDTPEHRAMNRRVEFVLVNQESPRSREGITLF
jgi:chemotaxis protein MotB